MKTAETIHRLTLTFLGVGRFPWAPGTAGSLAAVLVGAASWYFCPDPFRIFLFPVLALLASIGCIVCGSRIESIFGHKDPGAVVIDEVAGQFVALSAIPFISVATQVATVELWILAFLLFRLLDVLKPLGIRRLETLPEGWGGLLDDIAAGAGTAVLLLLSAPLLAGN